MPAAARPQVARLRAFGRRDAKHLAVGAVRGQGFVMGAHGLDGNWLLWCFVSKQLPALIGIAPAAMKKGAFGCAGGNYHG